MGKKTKLTLVKKKFAKFVARPEFRRVYVWAAAVTLLITTVYWAILGARLQAHNADQLIDPYLFVDQASFGGALFPAAHSMLVKWPVFWVIGAGGTTQGAVLFWTVVFCLLTVAGLAAILSRIERRPLVLGTWLLALSLALLLVPLQPYTGALLPVQMAMLATRNIEYVVFMLSAVLLIRAKSWLTVQYLVGVGLLGLLVVSDRLFLGLGLGAAVGMYVFGRIRRNKSVSQTALRLGVAHVGAVIVSAAITAGVVFMSGAQLVSAAASPYSMVMSVKQLVTGVIYAVLGIFTNFGANPAFDATTIQSIVPTAFHRLVSLAGLGYVVTAAVAVYIVKQSSILVTRTPKNVKNPRKQYATASLLSLFLIAAAITATGLFVVTDHYYAVDARYLTIWLFAGFIAATTTCRTHKIDQKKIVLIGFGIGIAICSALWGASQIYTDQSKTYTDIQRRNQTVATMLQKQHIEALVGDYWRVVPIRSATAKPLTIVPLGSCTEFRDALASSAWRRGLKKQRVAVLVSTQKGFTDFPACTLAEMRAAFGEPTSSTVIDTDAAAPSELLLIYDKGIFHTKLKTLVDTPKLTCEGRTILQIVAHPDDDLLFFSPDLLHDIQAGNCVRTVYVTVGDAGWSPEYWNRRRHGAQAAYNRMLGQDMTWDTTRSHVNGGQRITMYSPRGNSRITAISLNLPDGSPRGVGYASSQYTSLQKLLSGQIGTIQSVDQLSSFNEDQLVTALVEVIRYIQPDEVRTFSTRSDSIELHDHSDHLAVGTLTRKAYEKISVEGTGVPEPHTYIGYPVYGLEQNVFDDDLAAKEATFLTYAAFDGAVCQSAESCHEQSVYGAYITRQYRDE